MIERLIRRDINMNGEYDWIDLETEKSYKFQKEYLQQEILGFCGCGNQDAVMEYVRDFLVQLDIHNSSCYEDLPYMFLCYWANNNGFSEHNTTVRCSWLTDRGKALLSDINWCLDNEVSVKE